MVNSIRPTYYAQGFHKADFVLEGTNFQLIPLDAIGVLSTDNDNPLINRNTNNPDNIVPITMLSPFGLTLEQDAIHNRSYNVYLGTIISADRQTVYWENNTKPLPTS